MVRKFVVIFLFSGASYTIGYAQYNYYKKGVEDYLASNFPQSIQQLTTYLERTELVTDKKIQREAYYVRALAHYRLQDYSAAIQDFERTLLLDHPNQGNIHWFLGNAYSYSQNWQQAINEYSMALRQLEQNTQSISELLVSRGNAFLKVNEQSQALIDFKRALELNPADTKAYDAITQLDKSFKREGNNRQKISEPVTLSFPQKKATEKRCALVIGNADFILNHQEQKTADLLDKAMDMSTRLKKSGFEVQLLTNASYRQMRDAIEQFNLQFTTDATFEYFVFYYAGEVINYQDDYFLLPSKAELEYEEDITRICFAVHNRIKKMLGDVKSKNRVFIVESATQPAKIWFE